MIASAASKFDAQGSLKDDIALQRMRDVLDALLQFMRKQAET